MMATKKKVMEFPEELVLFNAATSEFGGDVESQLRDGWVRGEENNEYFLNELEDGDELYIYRATIKLIGKFKKSVALVPADDVQ
jgi:hypothetical protein